MPVLAHLVVGLATALPLQRRLLKRGKAVAAAGFLVPLGVLLAYLPDLCSWAIRTAGVQAAKDPCHSVLIAAGLSVLAVSALRACGIPWGSSLAVGAGGIVGHLGLDALQSTGTHPWWPFSTRSALANPPLPHGVAGELIVIGASLAAYGLYRISATPRGGRSTPTQSVPLRIRVPSALLVLTIGVSAVLVFTLREDRERRLERARRLVETGRAEEGLGLLEAADRWPSSAKPGRVDYYRGAAHLALGDRERAEGFLLRAYAADPHYLWVVYDLAVFYAEDSRRPLEERRLLAKPFIDSLARDFAGRPDAVRGLLKARRKLGLQP